MTKKECAIVMARTGICMLAGEDFQIFHKYVESIMGRPVYTHEMGDPRIANEIKENSTNDFLLLCQEATPSNSENPNKCEDAISRQDAIDFMRKPLSAACAIEYLENAPSVTPKQPTEDWSRVRVKEYRQGQINILKIIEANIQSEIKRIREEMQGLKESEG